MLDAKDCNWGFLIVKKKSPNDGTANTGWTIKPGDGESNLRVLWTLTVRISNFDSPLIPFF